jgi:hypothetical protein
MSSHDRGWPRFSLTVQTGSSPQTYRIYVHCQGGIDTHDARGADWEGVQYRPLPPIAPELPERPVDDLVD